MIRYMNTEINDKLDVLIALSAKDCGNDDVEIFRSLDTSDINLGKIFYAKQRRTINKYERKTTVTLLRKCLIRVAVALMALMSVGFLTVMAVPDIGASIFIVVGVQNASMQKLLKEGEFTEKEKKRTSVKEAVGFAYWGVLTAIFFIWGFLGNDGSGIQGNSWISWRYNWIVFAVGGILFPIVMMLCNLIADKDKKD